MIVSNRVVIPKNQEQENMSKDMDFRYLREIYPTNIKSKYWIRLIKQQYMLYKLLPKRSP